MVVDQAILVQFIKTTFCMFQPVTQNKAWPIEM